MPNRLMLAAQLYPHPTRIRAVYAYPNCNMRKKGEDIPNLSDKSCKTMSDPYPKYESHAIAIYKILQLLAPAEFR